MLGAWRLPSPLARLLLAGGLAIALLLSGCVDGSKQPVTSVLVPDVRAVSLTAAPDGSLLWAERASGLIMRWTDGSISEIAQVRVSTEGQRGLLGIAQIDDRVYAAWTDDDERMVVAEVSPNRREVWTGFASRKGANGGRLSVTPDGLLLIGIGTLLDSSLIDDPDTINGKMLTLDPLGPADQQPALVSSGWNNPFAFVYVGERLWVADNHPSEGQERLTWANEPDAPVTVMPFDSAPTGLATIDGRLYVCGYNTRALYRYNTNELGRAIRAGTVADDCRFDVTTLGDRLVYASTDNIMVIDNVG